MRKYCMWFWRWYWKRKKYIPLVPKAFHIFKVGSEGSIHKHLGPFIVKALDPDEKVIWVQFIRREKDA